ncbi:MAG: amidohydrolase family protein [Phycisphaerae bacterium]
MAVVLTNALLVDIDPPRVEPAELRIDGGSIVERSASVTRGPGDEIVDCTGGVVLPGLVNGHTHLYSALAVGMPPPPQAPANFHEILRFVWWRLDQALDAPSIEMSARIGAIQALRCGTTTLIDHHASPNCIDGSLDLLEKSLADVGLRGVLCYEVTDRHGPEGRHAGLEENRRFLDRCMRREHGRFAGLVGAHASFTLEDQTLTELVSLAGEFDTGVHIHVAEDACDEEHCQSEYQMFLLDRLANHGLLRPEAVLAHGTHFDAEAVARVNDVGLTIAHNPRSNMNNAVGYAPVGALRCPVMLGTDGIGADMFAEAKAAWYISRHEQGQLTPATVLAMLAASARRASQALGVTLGRLEPGAAADVVITDYRPYTPLSADNLPGHFLFAMNAGRVRDVMAGGRWCLKDRQVVTTDADVAQREAGAVAADLWARMARIE